MNHPAVRIAFILCSAVPAHPQTSEVSLTLPGGAMMDFVWIEAGTFTMGSALEVEEFRYAFEKPAHEVAITSGFYIGKYEIRQRQWESVMGDNPSFRPGPNRPVEQVSWFDAREFVGRLNAAAGDSLYRLPTEAEWEYAARAGSKTRCSFGNDESLLGDYAWFLANNAVEGPKQVGLKLPNQWNLHDVHGNVWEWVQDWYADDYYAQSPTADPPGPLSGSERVVRGGIFNGHSRHLRSAYRAHMPPDEHRTGIGFRLVREGPRLTGISSTTWGHAKHPQ